MTNLTIQSIDGSMLISHEIVRKSFRYGVVCVASEKQKLPFFVHMVMLHLNEIYTIEELFDAILLPLDTDQPARIDAAIIDAAYPSVINSRTIPAVGHPVITSGATPSSSGHATADDMPWREGDERISDARVT